MSGCATLVDKLSKAVGQVGCLYALCTRSAYTSRFLYAGCPQAHLLCAQFVHVGSQQNQSVKFSCAHFTQGLLMQLNKEGY